jgi:hypothetical protein
VAPMVVRLFVSSLMSLAKLPETTLSIVSRQALLIACRRFNGPVAILLVGVNATALKVRPSSSNSRPYLG